MRVKDWHTFQHYSTRNPPWIKLHKSILDDPDWHGLDPAHAKALVMIWLIASESDGVLPNERKLAFRLRMTEKQCASTLSALSHWIIQDDSDALATRYQDASLEEDKEKETERDGERASARPPKRSISLPKDFEPDWSAATSLGFTQVEAAREFEKFKNYAALKGRTCLDWQAAWRNWCIKAAEFVNKQPPKPDGPKMATLRAGQPGWDQWKAHYRDTGQNNKAAQMDRFASEGKEMTFPTEQPPRAA